MATVCSEKELEDYLFKNLGSYFSEYGKYCIADRQVDLGAYGIADIISVNMENCSSLVDPGIDITVYELKKGDLNIADLGQLSRYMRGVERMYDLFVEYIGWIYRVRSVKGVLIGGSLDSSNSALCYLVDVCEKISVYTFDVNLDTGIELEEHSDFYRPSETPMPISKYVEKFKSEITEKLLFSVKDARRTDRRIRKACQ